MKTFVKLLIGIGLIYLAYHFSPSTATPSGGAVAASGSIQTAMYWGIGALAVLLIIGVLIIIRQKKKEEKEKKEKEKVAAKKGDPPAVETAKNQTKETGAKDKWSIDATLKWVGTGIWQVLKFALLFCLMMGGLAFVAGLIGNLQEGSLLGGPAPRPIEKRWQLTWTKPPGVAAGDASVRRRSFSVKMLEDNTYNMKFVQYYEHNFGNEEALFTWKKDEQRGEWKQKNPEAHGTWYLVEMKPGFYSGKQIGSAGTEYDMTLELVSPQ